METLLILSALAWIGLLLAPWQPWSTRERIEPAAAPGGEGKDLGSVTVLIPARNEAAVLERTLRALQACEARVILIDDQSDDGTADLARSLLPAERLVVVAGEPLPVGWSGKLWALEQGLQRVETDLTLLLDADIELAPGVLEALRAKLIAGSLDLVSVMAELRMESFWEKLLVPAFVYFFKLLYPFALSNSIYCKTAAAAGGCVLLNTALLRQIGGFASIRGALIDDCTLARRVKEHSGRTWIGLSHSVRSHRAYPDLASLWSMVSRSAFTQLRYSVFLLLVTTGLMLTLFWGPVVGLFAGSAQARHFAWAGCAAMLAAYAPTLRYYGRSALWLPALPVIGALYMLMTWSSALDYWRGTRSRWKGRAYARMDEPVMNSESGDGR